MSCGGCGCCPKCGCRATCTCNRNIFSLESQTDFSYATGMSFTADETDGGDASESCITVAGGNGGECVNCSWHALGAANNAAFTSISVLSCLVISVHFEPYYF